MKYLSLKILLGLIFVGFLTLPVTFAASIEDFLNPENLQMRVTNPVQEDDKIPENTEKVRSEPLFSVAAIPENLNIPTLMFHHIEYQKPSNSMRYYTSVSPEKFEEILKYLQKNNIETLTFFDVQEIINGKKVLPEKSIILTFDDGYSSQYSNAFPLLKKYGQKGVFFIIADRPERGGDYMSWEAIRAIESAGNEIGSHTLSHPNLTKVSPLQQEREIIESKGAIERRITNPIISFSYPYGGYNSCVVELARQRYTFARTTDTGVLFSKDTFHTIHTIHTFPKFKVKSLDKWYQ